MKPSIPLHDSRFKYTKSIDTDVRKTFARFGFRPPTEQRDAKVLPIVKKVK